MRGYLFLILGVLLLILSISFLYNGYAPKVGPIGNGPNHTLVWVNFGWTFLLAMSSILKAILVFNNKW